jgi:hypothetical protein
MEQRTDRAYRLIWESDHLEFCDAENDIELRIFPKWRETSSLMETTPYELPNPVIFEGDFKMLPCTDYPMNNVYWPVMSRKMYYTLLALGDFSHRVIPTAIMDDGAYPFESHRCFLADGQPSPEVTNFDDFVAVQLLEHSDYFDFERSEYDPDEEYPTIPNYIHRYALNEPTKGFPPLFKLAAQRTKLFISSEAHEALKKAGIRGTAYYRLNDQNRSEVDIPVEIPTYP